MMKRLASAAVVLLWSILLLQAMGAGEVLATTSPATASTTRQAGDGGGVAFAAVQYFQDKCAGCHGSYGTFYPPQFGKGDDAHLRRVVEEMAEGPAQAPLAERELEAVVAYHRALLDQSGGPFVSVTKATGQELAGEVTPGATVYVYFGERRSAADVTGHKWRLFVPPGRKIDAARVVARKGGRSTELPVGEGLSHRAPTTRAAE